VSLSEVYRELAGPIGPEPPDLARLLGALCARGRQAHPALVLADEAFVRHLARLSAAADDEPPALESLAAEDLFLASACLEGVPGATESFDAHCAGRLRAALVTIVKSDDARAEVLQRVREAVLVGTAGARPKLAAYAGQGPLDGWVAIVAQRLAISLGRHEAAGRRAHERATMEAAIVSQEPEVAFIKEQYKGEFERAFADALALLGERDRTLMRLHLVSGVSVESLGKMHNVSQSTASRWLASAREVVGAEVERLLGDRLSLARSEMASLAGLVASQIDLSMSRILR